MRFQEQNLKQREAGKMNQWLLFVKTWAQLPTTTWCLTAIYNSSSSGSDALFWLPQSPDMHMVHIPICGQNIHTHKFSKVKAIDSYLITLYKTQFQMDQRPQFKTRYTDPNRRESRESSWHRRLSEQSTISTGTNTNN